MYWEMIINSMGESTMKKTEKEPRLRSFVGIKFTIVEQLKQLIDELINNKITISITFSIVDIEFYSTYLKLNSLPFRFLIPICLK